MKNSQSVPPFGRGGGKQKGKKKKKNEKQKEKQLNPVFCPLPSVLPWGEWALVVMAARGALGLFPMWLVALGSERCWGHQPWSFWITRSEMSFGHFVGSGLTFPCPLPPSAVICGRSEQKPRLLQAHRGCGRGGGAGLSPARHRRGEGPLVRVPGALALSGRTVFAHPAPGAFWGPCASSVQPGGQAFGMLSPVPRGSPGPGSPTQEPPAPPTSFPRERNGQCQSRKVAGDKNPRESYKNKRKHKREPSVN